MSSKSTKRFIVQVHPLRFAAGLTVLVLWLAAMVWVGIHGSLPLQLLAGALYVIPFVSLMEWFIHGFVYHGRFPLFEQINRFHTAHHWQFFTPENYVQEGNEFAHMNFLKRQEPFEMSKNSTVNFLGFFLQGVFHVAFGSPIVLGLVWLVAGIGPFFWSAAVVGYIVSFFLPHVHGVMHTPSYKGIENTFWFKFLDHHHYVHHVDVSKNLNFMLPICDVLFGTFKPSMAPHEVKVFPAFEVAKPLPGVLQKAVNS